jgi:hypothetical protein
MDIGNNGVVYVVFSNWNVGGDPTSTAHIWYADSASNWINVQIDSNVTTNWWDDRINPSIDVDSNNTAHVVWEDQRNTALPGDPAYYGSTPNRKEVYYANSGNAWANVEIALPIDTTVPRKKTNPAIFVQNSTVHVSWIQKETDDPISQENLFYSNSSNWDNAINISNHFDSPIPGTEGPGQFIPSHRVYSSSNALSVDKNGISHVTWSERDNSNNNYKIFYASNTKPGVEIQIDIKPGSYPNIINPRSKGKIPVAILSSMDFDATTEMDTESLTFGPTGGEESLNFCNRSTDDVNNDGYDDVVCHFYTKMTGFECGDEEGIMIGEMVDGTPFEGSDSVRIVPSACR